MTPEEPPKQASRPEGMQGADRGMQAMDHGSMDHGAMEGMHQGSMDAMDQGSMQGMERSSMQGMDHGSSQGTLDMPMGPMQGGNPPAGARDPDYSDGTGYGPTQGLGMAMEDSPRFTKVLLDQLETFHGKDGNGQRWDAEGWYGDDYDKLWLRTEGERTGGELEDGNLEALWNHTVATFWTTQLGVRADVGRGPNRTWAAFGIQGLAPYWFEVEATGYVGPAGRTAARVRAEYELFLTQRLILQPELEANLYGTRDPARRLGAGLSDGELGLRLRYEIRREFAPYIGVVWVRRFGGTADFARADGEGILDRQWVAGFRIWF
jgi:copper resistance protein B